MKKTITILSLLFAATLGQAQNVGMSCQYFPGLQVGFVSVKTTSQYGNYRYGAPVPLLLVDRLKNNWYTNIDFSSFYYSATQTNKANDDRLKISKAEGAMAACRVGYAFGESENFRFGIYGAAGFSTSNLDSTMKPFEQRGYYNYGLGILAYQKFGKFKVMGKIGYDLYKRKSYVNKGHGLYFEGTIGYTFYQKYGVSVMPCFYSKKMDYLPNGSNTVANAKVRSFVLRVGITKFF